MVKPMSLMSENMESYISSKFIVPEIRKSKGFFPTVSVVTATSTQACLNHCKLLTLQFLKKASMNVIEFAYTLLTLAMYLEDTRRMCEIEESCWVQAECRKHIFFFHTSQLLHCRSSIW